jgi:cell shape-determining protein MreC
MYKQYVPKKYPYRGILIAGGIFILILIVPVSRVFISRTLSAFGTGMLRIANGSSGWLSRRFELLETKSSLLKENQFLSNQIAELEARIAERSILASENEELKKAFNRNEVNTFILAAVLAKPPKSLYDTLLIDGGESIGLRVGQSVYVHGRIPVGTIEEVRSNSALVRLYSSPGEKTDVRLSPLGVDATLVGRGGGAFSATLPHDITLTDEVLAVSIGISQSIIAQFEKVTSDSRDAAQTALFSSPVNMSELTFVQVKK